MTSSASVVSWAIISKLVLAAPTTSLPEDIGGVCNWDYRYNWIRDAAFTVQALVNLGHVDEATAYFDWFLDLCHADEPAKLQPLYGLHGDGDLDERELAHLSGYRGSASVRVGNAAAEQRQLDTYGELVLAIAEMCRQGEVLSGDDWTAVRGVVEYTADVWTERDKGIWEIRCDPEHFVHSKVMCWTALDRGIALAESHGFDAPLNRWRETKAEIKTTVIEKGYDEEQRTFRRSFDDPDGLDATGLLIPIVGFLPFDDERIQGTIETIRERLVGEDGLVHRYEGPDGLPGGEGAFVWCSFWLVDALALSGRVDEAEGVFADIIDYVSPVGLLSEEVDPDTGAHLGNTPQAFSHIGLLNSTLYLGRARRREPLGAELLGIELGSGVAIDDS